MIFKVEVFKASRDGRVFTNVYKDAEQVAHLRAGESYQAEFFSYQESRVRIQELESQLALFKRHFGMEAK